MVKIDYWMWRCLQEVKDLKPEQEIWIESKVSASPDYATVTLMQSTENGMACREIFVRKE